MAFKFANTNQSLRILVIRLSALGDVLLATPAIRALKHHFASATIDWLVEKPYLPLIEGNPYVRALEYDKKGKHSGSNGLWDLRKYLKDAEYDLVIDLQNKPKTWWLRVGKSNFTWSKRSTSKALLALLGHDPPAGGEHAIERFISALQPLGVKARGQELDLVITPAMNTESAQLFSSGNSIAGIAPGTRWATKRWSPQRFAQLVEKLVDHGYSPVLLGGPSDHRSIQEVRSLLPPSLQKVPDTCCLGVGGLASTIARASLVVAGDSGPVHIASATSTPVVALFGPTNPERWRPLSSRSVVVKAPNLKCSPCSNHGSNQCPRGFHECMKKIEVEDVMTALNQMQLLGIRHGKKR